MDVGNWISGSSAFSKTSLNIWKFSVHIVLKPHLENLSIILLACEISTIVWQFEHSLALPFFGIGMKTDIFQSCGHCWVFQICWHIECSTFTVSSFRIWNSSTGIPTPPLALLVVMLPKAHLTPPSRISGSRWVITSSWLSGSWRSFLYSSSVYSCHLFLISSASVTQTHAHRVDDAIQPSHFLLSHTPPAFNLSQHQGLFWWVSSLHQVAKVLELQLR